MDRRFPILAGALAVLAIIVAVVLVTGGEDDAAEETTQVFGEKPTVEVPEGEPPTELVTEDLIEGEGPEAQEGDQLQIDYLGVLYDTGAEFDTSFGTGMPLPVTLGQGGVIPGFEQGLEGMKAGGRRQIIIPPDLGYGAQGSPPDIPPDATLIFVIDLVSIG